MRVYHGLKDRKSICASRSVTGNGHNNADRCPWNSNLGVRKAQAAAMLGGAMHGWVSPAASLRSYDGQSQPSPLGSLIELRRKAYSMIVYLSRGIYDPEISIPFPTTT